MPPSPLVNSTFSQLIVLLQKAMDNWNSSDQTRSTPTVDSNSSGEVAGICVNAALQICYNLVKDSKYLKALPSTQFVSVAGQDFIDLDIEPGIDEIEAMMDTTNNIRVMRKSWNFYRRNYPDPSKVTGTSLFYTRRDSRIYLMPRPTVAITYTVDFVKLTNDLVNDGDACLFPQTYNFWIVSEAMVRWMMMEDPDNIPQKVIDERNRCEQIATNSILSGFDVELESESHWNENQTFSRDYQRPVGG